ncbi:hypothetical protein BX600DRAFT_250003 [Xylariales sp. PMI_506]|nr:hypothetical protein BX600DRAFT_250003 [Xylariales sp. PMI_506]
MDNPPYERAQIQTQELQPTCERDSRVQNYIFSLYSTHAVSCTPHPDKALPETFEVNLYMPTLPISTRWTISTSRTILSSHFRSIVALTDRLILHPQWRFTRR